VLASDLELAPIGANSTLADLLATLPRAERRQFTRTWRFTREAFALVDQVIRRPLPGADQAEQAELLLSFLIWRLRLIRRSIRRARLGE
jgi:hypothetical protein